MTREARARGSRYLVATGIVAVILIAGLIALQPYGFPLNWFIRAAALLGYLTIFLSILSSTYMRQSIRLFGRPFVQVHHILSITGLALITLHPLGVVLDWNSPRVLLPRLDSLPTFFRWGGPPALYLIIVALLAVLLRKSIGKGWRVIHALNYVGFLLGTVHAVMLGTDFAGSGLRPIIVKIVAITLGLAVAAMFVQKRLQRRGK